MVETLGGDGNLNHGEVGKVVVFVVAVLGSPAEDVEGEIGIGLGAEGFVDIGRAEAGFELVDPCLELLLERSSSSRVRVRDWGGMVGGWWR